MNRPLTQEEKGELMFYAVVIVAGLIMFGMLAHNSKR